MNPDENTAAASVEVGRHQSWMRVCVKVWASYPAIHLLSKHVSPVRPHHCCIHWGSPVTWDDTHIETDRGCNKVFLREWLSASFHSISATYKDKLSLQAWMLWGCNYIIFIGAAALLKQWQHAMFMRDVANAHSLSFVCLYWTNGIKIVDISR